jgi:azurin
MAMKQLWIILGLLAMIFAAGCESNKSQRPPEEISDEPLQRQEADQDTTLQDIEVLIIRAVGGEDTASMRFDQDTLEVKASSLVRLELINEGTDPKMIYNIVFIRPGLYKQAAEQGSKAGAPGNYLPDSSIMLAASPLALPGQTVILEFTAPDKPGTYDFVSTYPGDFEKLRGKLIVK